MILNFAHTISKFRTKTPQKSILYVIIDKFMSKINHALKRLVHALKLILCFRIEKYDILYLNFILLFLISLCLELIFEVGM
jgi:hypothetical protein